MGYYREGAVATPSDVAALVGEIPGSRDLRAGLERVHAEASRDPDAFVWIGLFQPTKSELDVVADVFGLDLLQVEDAANPRQRAKFEVGKDGAFVLLKILGYVERTSDVETGQIAVFVGPSYAVTVRHGELGDLRVVRSRLERTPELLRTGPSAVLYAVADAVVDGYLAVAEAIQDDVEEIGEAVFSPLQKGDNAARIYRLKRENVEMRRAVQPMVPVAHDMVNERFEEVPDGLRPYFRDVGDHLLRVNDMVEGSDSLLMTMLMASTARQDLQQNSDMRKISAWVAIAAVPTMIAGVYGMNFDFMPELHWRFGYAMVLALMGGACFLMYRAFKRSGWL